jgi:hypothetical protein
VKLRLYLLFSFKYIVKTGDTTKFTYIDKNNVRHENVAISGTNNGPKTMADYAQAILGLLKLSTTRGGKKTRTRQSNKKRKTRKYRK